VRRGGEGDEQGTTGAMTGGSHQGGGGCCNRPRTPRAGNARGSRVGRARRAGEGARGRPRQVGPAPAGPRRGGPRGREKRRGEASRGWAKRREGEIFLFLFSSYFPIIQFIHNFLLNAYLTETKQLHPKGNRCVVQHDATTKENISRVYLYKMSS
jgi:hypothetical protein